MGEHAIGPDGQPVDVTPVQVAGHVAIPLPLVLAAWLGWLLALALGLGAPRSKEHQLARRAGEPWASYASALRPAAWLLLLATQLPIVVALLMGF